MRFSGAQRPGKEQTASRLIEKLADGQVSAFIGAGYKIFETVRSPRLELQWYLRRKQHSEITGLFRFLLVKRAVGVFPMQMANHHIQCGSHRQGQQDSQKAE